MKTHAPAASGPGFRFARREHLLEGEAQAMTGRVLARPPTRDSTHGADSARGAAGRAGMCLSGGDLLAVGPAASRHLHRVLSRPGQPLPEQERASLGRRFGMDFGQVRIHADAEAAHAARAARARALTHGMQIVFGAGRWQPGTSQGRALLAHELAHVVQAPRDDGRTVLRDALNLADFEGGSFDEPTLQIYLEKLRKRGTIEDGSDSDDKAREVVKHWRAGGDDYVLEPADKVLLIQEMQSGFTGNDDERAILNLLEYSAQEDVVQMFGPGALDPDDLDDDFQGLEEDALRSWYDGHIAGGRKAALAGSTTFVGVKDKSVGASYDRAALRAAVDEQLLRLDRTLRDRGSDKRSGLADAAARRSARALRVQVNAWPVDQQARAAKDLAADRSRADSRAKALDGTMAKAATQQATEVAARQQIMAHAEVLMLDLLLQPAMLDVAQGASADPAVFQKTTTALSADQKKAAKEAITPMTQAEVEAEASGAAPPPAPVFKPKLDDGTLYEDRIKARIPDLINERHAVYGVPRSKKVHDDKTQTRTMDDMQRIANKSKDEVDLVFGSFYDKGKMAAFQADKRNAKGVLTKKGNLRDAWQVEEDRRKADKTHAAGSAHFWLFYLIQNDDAIAAINLEHDASPSFGDGAAPQNDEAKLIRKVGDPFVKSEKTRLFEIGRGWDAFEQDKDIFIQLFKKATPEADRRFLWDMYFVLMHEYLHKLASKPYNDYAESLGGEHSTEGNTLIEGVDSVLTEVTWTSAAPRAGQKEIREVVEPDAVKAGLAFDAKLLPVLPHRRYDTYQQAVRLLGVVGPNNLYAAYFQGRVDLIGGP